MGGGYPPYPPPLYPPLSCFSSFALWMLRLQMYHFEREITQAKMIGNRLWLAKCCKIQQLIIFIQQKYLFNFNKNNFIQQKYLFNFNKNNFIQQKYLFNFNKNNFIQQKYLFNFNKIISFNKNIYSTSTKIFIQLQQKYLFNFNKIISFNKNIYSTSTKIFIQLQQKYLFNFNKK